ncbi:MAG: RNA-binding protein [Patescibacteria group bacterium]
MAKKLFIGSFPLNTTEQVLRELFTAQGQVLSFTIVMDQDTRTSRGFGFVEMASDEAAQLAIEKLNGYKLGDRNIVVKEALAKTSYTGMNDFRGFGNRNKRRF